MSEAHRVVDCLCLTMGAGEASPQIHFQLLNVEKLTHLIDIVVNHQGLKATSSLGRLERVGREATNAGGEDEARGMKSRNLACTSAHRVQQPGEK